MRPELLKPDFSGALYTAPRAGPVKMCVGPRRPQNCQGRRSANFGGADG